MSYVAITRGPFQNQSVDTAGVLGHEWSRRYEYSRVCQTTTKHLRSVLIRGAWRAISEISKLAHTANPSHC